MAESRSAPTKMFQGSTLVVTSDTTRNQALTRWLYLYNHHRTHTSLGGQPPMTRVNNLPGQHS